jgi:hypothetical protein
MDDDEKAKGQGKVKMDVSPLVAVKTQKIFRALCDRRSLGNYKAQENSDKDDACDANKKQ